MKILKKLLIVGLFSFLFLIPSVFAVANVSSTTNNNIELYLQNHLNNDVNDFKEMVLNDFELPDSEFVSDNYVILTNPLNYNSRTLRLFYLSSSYNQNIAYNYNYGSPAVYLRNAGTGENFNYCYRDYHLNTSGEISSKDNYICYTTNTWFAFNPDTYIFATNYPYFEYKAPSWNSDDFSINNGTTYSWNGEVPINFKNGGIYNIDVTDYLNPTTPEPIIYEPQIEYFNGYNKVTYYIDNYTLESLQSGYFVRIVNNTDGTFENISPDVNNINQVITKNYYENVNLSLQIHDREYNILSHYEINTDINYQKNANYSIRINDVSNEQRIVYYDYLIENNNNVKCYYSINGNNFIEDTNCMDKTYTYYLQLSENGNITWEIRDAQNNTLYNYSQNFVFNVSDPFINFKDSFNNDFLNLDVLINRYQNNDTIEYSINNSQFIQVNFLEDYSVSQNIKYFTINNINNNDLIIVRVKRNNEIITIGKYRANYLKYYNGSNENFNMDNIFNRININNINEELKNYIKYFGNLILNSKIGNLLLLETFCLVITIIIKMIRN